MSATRNPDEYDPEFNKDFYATEGEPQPAETPEQEGDTAEEPRTEGDPNDGNEYDLQKSAAEGRNVTRRSTNPTPNGAEDGDQVGDVVSAEGVEPRQARSPGDLDNTVAWDYGQGEQSIPVKDIANGLAEPPEIPQVPIDDPRFEALVEIKAEQAAEDARNSYRAEAESLNA